jgi:hypothetical protein
MGGTGRTRGKLMADADWNFNNSSVNESTLRPLCEQVDKEFGLANKYYRYFAVTPDDFLTKEVGSYFRGVRFPTWATDEVSSHVRDRYLPSGTTKYESLIYIRDTTCLDPAGCVVTYAHELQHILQHERFPKLMQPNSILRARLKDFVKTATEIDIPIEVDANIVSKRVAERLCGVESVRRFAEEQVHFMEKEGAVDQIVRWKFFRDTPSSNPYDYVEETLKLVQKYKGQIFFGEDVDSPDWWKSPIDDYPAGGW